MYRYLNTEFSEEELGVIRRHCDKFKPNLLIVHGINMDLFDVEGYEPLRIIETNIGGYYIMDEEGYGIRWQLGQFNDNIYNFHSVYSSLEVILEGL